MARTKSQVKYEKNPLIRKMKSIRTMMSQCKNRGDTERAEHYQQKLVEIKAKIEEKRVKIRAKKME